jgi:hypothetical protein
MLGQFNKLTIWSLMAVYEIEGKVFNLPSTLQGEELKSLLQDIQDVMRAYGWNRSPLPDAQTPHLSGSAT